MNKLIKGPPLHIPDPLQQILSVPIFKGAFFGEDDNSVYSDMAEIVLKASPRLGHQCDIHMH